jgi:hypothetical protein
VEALEEGHAAEEAMGSVLRLFLDSAGCRRGSLVAPGADRRVQVIAAADLPAEPFLSGPDTLSIARQHFIPLPQPVLVNPAQSVEVGRVLAAMSPPVKGLAVVPVRSGLGVHALVLLYYSPAETFPAPEQLAHFGLLARALASWFVLRRGHSLTSSATAVKRALPEIESVVRAASELVRTASEKPGEAPGLLDQAARALDGIVGLAKSLGRP